jgi:hypothetical protein
MDKSLVKDMLLRQGIRSKQGYERQANREAATQLEKIEVICPGKDGRREEWKGGRMRLFCGERDGDLLFLNDFGHTVTTVSSVRAIPSFIVFRSEQRQKE